MILLNPSSQPCLSGFLNICTFYIFTRPIHLYDQHTVFVYSEDTTAVRATVSSGNCDIQKTYEFITNEFLIRSKATCYHLQSYLQFWCVSPDLCVTGHWDILLHVRLLWCLAAILWKIHVTQKVSIKLRPLFLYVDAVRTWMLLFLRLFPLTR